MNLDQANGFQDHSKCLRRYAIARTRDPAEADDLVQECLTRALTYARKGKTIDNPRAYLFAILNNVLADKWAQMKRSASVISLNDDAEQIAEAPSQLMHIEWQELVRAIDQLPETQRRVILLVGLEGVPYRSAAEIMDIPLGTVMSRLSRGREALRRTLVDEAVLPS